MTGATTEFEDEVKKLNDYIRIPGYRRSLPSRRWDPVLAITGFHHYYDAKRFQIHVDNAFRVDNISKDFYKVKHLKENLLIRPCILKRIICARNVFRRLFTENFPKENPKVLKLWKLHWSKELDQDMIKELAFGWDIEDFKNDVVQNGYKIDRPKKTYFIEHVKLEFDDFLPWKEILNEWRILKEERKTLGLEDRNKDQQSKKIEQKIVNQEQEQEHWFKVVDDYEDD
ncbi:49_t:CDS:2 [Cetraspora pellucida]|uniref:49_t:CDS:1 n=1 Tax=Cetraspora pellucida TaxID=1433469 RepID=A0A9N9D3K9_9GLOM|nr:49_t:CDS:2 [Cetraspora pellucida]